MSRARRITIGVAAGTAAAALGAVLIRRRVGTLRFTRGLSAAALVTRAGARYATSAPRLFAAAGESREQLRNDLALQTAQDVTSTLGAMKGVLVKLGQMASYVDEGLAAAGPPDAQPAAGQHPAHEPGTGRPGHRPRNWAQPPDVMFAEWDPEPIAAASIGQVHRAITRDGRAVAVKVQYPGVAETMAADLDNVALLRRMLKITAPHQDVEALIAELRERVLEELDYRREASNQRLLAAYYEGHPSIHVPAIVDGLSTRRVVTSELSDGARFAELANWSQEERDLAGETIYRFVFRSLYELHAFNGDPHPGNYLFHGDGRVTFLDFGLVKYFTAEDLRPLMDMVRTLCVSDHDRRSSGPAWRRPASSPAARRSAPATGRRRPGPVLRAGPRVEGRPP